MSEFVPTTEEVRRQYRAPAVSVDLTDPQRKGENFADYLGRVAGVDAFRHQQASYLAFDRWLAEVERAAAEKAYEQGRLDERHDCTLTTAHLELPPEKRNQEELRKNLRSNNPYRAEAYRREGKE